MRSLPSPVMLCRDPPYVGLTIFIKVCCSLFITVFSLLILSYAMDDVIIWIIELDNESLNINIASWIIDNTNEVIINQGEELIWSGSDYISWEIIQDDALWSVVWISDGWPVVNSNRALSYWDIQISEVFPSSGDCLNEFVKIHAYVSYQWLISIYGLWSSTGSVMVWVDMQPWSDIVVTDTIGGIVPDTTILLVNSVTLTNAWETLKLIVSWEVVDQIYYSNLQWVQSLFFTESSDQGRLFTTNGSPSLFTTCNQVSPVNLRGWVGLCDIILESMDYRWTGLYELLFELKGEIVSGCNVGINNFSWERIINWISHWYWACRTSFQTQLGLNTVEINIVDNQNQVRCYDHFVFATNYDVWVVKQYVSPPKWGWSCQDNNQSGFFPSTDCGIQFQWSPIGFFANRAFNFVTTYNNKTLLNTNKQYKCTIYMGDGSVLEECNPSSYKYTKPWVYGLVVEIFDGNNHQLLCKTRTFINAPPSAIDWNQFYDHLLSIDQKLGEYCSAISLEKGISGENGLTCDMSLIQDLCKSFESSWFVFDANIQEQNAILCDSWSIQLNLFSVLPNPVWSDAQFEEFSVYNSAIVDLSDMSDYTVLVGYRSIKLTGTIAWMSVKSFIGWWWLKNDGMCLSLVHKQCGLVQKSCYDKVQESQVVSFVFWSWEVGHYSWTEQGLLRASQGKQIKLPTRIAGPKTTKLYTMEFEQWINSSAKELSCTEKIKMSKAKDKEKYDKLKVSRAKDKQLHKTQLDKMRLKEQIARNNRYLYENTTKLLASTLKSEWPLVYENSKTSEIVWVAHYLEVAIGSWFIYTDKNSAKRLYKYTNNIKLRIEKEKSPTVLDVVFPHLSDYIESLRLYELNKTTIEKI